MKELIVNKKYDGKKLNTFLLDTFPALSLNTVYKLLRKRDIRVNNIRIHENVLLQTGDSVKVYLSDEKLSDGSSSKINCKSINPNFKLSDKEIIYEDDNICIVNKPVGIEVTGENSLTEALLLYYSSFISPCHRLDRNTTGLVLFAKNEESLSILLEKFKNHEIEKHYLAKVYGIPASKKATLTAYLFKDSKKSLVYISDVPKKGYEKIITSYEMQSSKQKENTSILDINLHTGKTHQIRAHLAHIGYPIIGDGKYGNNQINKQFGVKVQQLCSYSLSFQFKTDSGILDYLNHKKFELENLPISFSKVQ